jgi:NitT/TauT family transport system ATP-binding protein
MSTTLPILECKKLAQRYRTRTGHQVIFEDLDFTLSGCSFVSIIGASGCGKSTLLRLILGSERPWKGVLRSSGEPITHPDQTRGIVFQRYSLFPHRTVLQNVTLGLELTSRSGGPRWLGGPWFRTRCHRRLIEEAMGYLREVKLADHADKYPHQLSGGMQQRAAIAQALVMRPRILLMDEPFGALDLETREALQRAIVRIYREHQTTVLFVTHDLHEALYVANRLIVLGSSTGAGASGSRILIDHPVEQAAPRGSKANQELLALVRDAGFACDTSL